MSVAAPLAVVEALLPKGRGRPWLGWFGITVLTVLAVGVAALIHFDEEGPDAETSVAKYALSLAFAVALAGGGLHPARPSRHLGRGARNPKPGGAGHRRVRRDGCLRPGSRVVAGPGPGPGLGRRGHGRSPPGPVSRSPGWTGRHLVAFAFGGILERTLIGFLVPTPPGGDTVGKVVQNVVVLVLVLALGALLRARTREPEPALRPAQGGR